MKRFYKYDGFIFLLLVSAMLLLIVASAGKQQQNPARHIKQQSMYDAHVENFFLLHA
ncbi:hypothetical protein [Lacibacter sediminis]|uniref:Uncharacterized protein n=1 Tax=Lacibacter sediminis TaxID=2760713 RepID=A0A7G5XF83_9BACT|nr:hypothetical protein [Lacibacter sediminis]QNA44136.1 hypothetical protein H4075_19010 [Lacibacter sediminis]